MNGGFQAAGLLFAAAGLAPSKDVTWTAAQQPGAPYPNPVQPNAALDFVLAVLSTGPLWIGDSPRFTNFSLLARCCDAAGTILRGSAPLTAIDRTFVPELPQRAIVGFLPPVNPDAECRPPLRSCSPKAYQTHAAISGSGGLWRYLVTIGLGPGLRLLPSRDLHPPAVVDGDVLIREFRWSRCHVGTTIQPGCAVVVPANQPLPELSSGPTLLDGSGSVAWRLWALYPRVVAAHSTDRAASAGAGWFFLGELDKVTSVSAQRFASVTAHSNETHSCVSWQMHIGMRESITVAAVAPSAVYHEATVVSEQCWSPALCTLCEPLRRQD